MHITSLGWPDRLYRGCPHRGHRFALSLGWNTLSLQPTHPWSFMHTDPDLTNFFRSGAESFRRRSCATGMSSWKKSCISSRKIFKVVFVQLLRRCTLASAFWALPNLRRFFGAPQDSSRFILEPLITWLTNKIQMPLRHVDDPMSQQKFQKLNVRVLSPSGYKILN